MEVDLPTEPVPILLVAVAAVVATAIAMETTLS